MSGRTYHDACGVASALDVVGERWALLVVRELLLGPRRFADLQNDLVGISPNVLTHRLASLAEAGVVRRVELTHPVRARLYELTDLGRGLRPALIELGRWGASLSSDEGGFSASSIVLSVLASDRATERGSLQFELTVGAEPFRVIVEPDTVDARRGRLTDPQCVVAGTHETFGDVMRGHLTLKQAARTGHLRIEGAVQHRRQVLDFLASALSPST
jgi:DNA-binding HxlR family transcriptional regulator/putative sterol carrier protein